MANNMANNKQNENITINENVSGGTEIKSIWKQTPDEVVKKILSYGDPIVTQRFNGVMRQIQYYNGEFHYHRTNHFRPFCRWYDVSETDYYMYALREVFLKKHVDKYYGELCLNYHSII